MKKWGSGLILVTLHRIYKGIEIRAIRSDRKDRTADGNTETRGVLSIREKEFLVKVTSPSKQKEGKNIEKRGKPMVFR